MDDNTLLKHISELVEEEDRLRADTARPEQHTSRLRDLEVQLDQCWDLLRQRRAKREFGDDPDSAKPRDPGTVEGYLN
jgi:hypothetical protein